MGEQVTVPVGIGELKASKDPSTVLVAYGLGSCVGVCIYDPVTKVAGLAHVMLPNSQEGAARLNSGKFADCAVPMLLDEVLRLGGAQSRLQGKIAGGAQMITAPGFTNGFNVGGRNIEAVKAALGKLRIPLLKSDTGGHRGRTLTMNVGSGKVMVRTIGEKETEL